MPSARPEAGPALPALGLARRWACVWQGDDAELVAVDDARVARRLRELGAEGAFGFVAGGEDEAGTWLVRRVPRRRLDGLAPGERWDGDRALELVLAVARALVACEARAIFPGPLRPEDVALGSDPKGAWITCDRYVAVLLGDAGIAPHAPSAPSPRWTPPEQAEGAPWDNAANRFVLGLLAYRVLAGAHPFSGIGLRDAANAARSAAPPFHEDVARALRPGVQSLVLAMLAPARAGRPGTATDVVMRARAVRDGLARPAAGRRAPDGETASARPEPSDSPGSESGSGRGLRGWRALAPVLLGAGVLGTGLARGERLRAPLGDYEGDAGVVRVRARAPLATADASTCAACHPRQVAEWRRSVMAHASRSPLFGALESAIQEQAGRDANCPNGAGILRRAGADVCRDPTSGVAVTGSGGEHWCVNCHAAGDNLGSRVPAWEASAPASRARRPLRDLLGASALEGISCAVCHQTVGPVHVASEGRARDDARDYRGNPTWTSPATGATFPMRPEDARGTAGIANSGYLLDPERFLRTTLGSGGPSDPIVHARTPEGARDYLRSSEACGACHDVRLFGTDTAAVKERGEHFKRLRNAYSEWRAWADGERAAGRKASTCQDCHMSLYPGVCVPGEAAPSGLAPVCPPGSRFEARAPGERARGLAAVGSSAVTPVSSHAFTSVDVPLGGDYPRAWAEDSALDPNGVPGGLELRRLALLRHTFRFALGRPTSPGGGRLEIPIELENVGAGHRVPAGFSQEREIWVELSVRDASGRVLYDVGRVDGDEADLRDKIMTRVTTRADLADAKGRPLGVFGADVIDGPDVPRWDPDPAGGPGALRGRGLVNLQNGFFRCVRCIGVVDSAGRCQPGPGQGRNRADRYADGDYDADTGACRSNLDGDRALFETYFPIGALDAERGIAKAADAILDTRSAAPRVPLRYTFDIDVGAAPRPLRVHARLRFRAFPPFLLRAFADYEANAAASGLRPSGPQVTRAMLARNRIVDLAEADATAGGAP